MPDRIRTWFFIWYGTSKGNWNSRRMVRWIVYFLKMLLTTWTSLILQITLDSSKDHLRCTMQRHQFPVSTAFAISMHKAKGQTLHSISVDLRIPVSVHWTLYADFFFQGLEVDTVCYLQKLLVKSGILYEQKKKPSINQKAFKSTNFVVNDCEKINKKNVYSTTWKTRDIK